MAKIDLGKSWDKVAKQWFKEWEPTFKRGLVWGPYGPFEKDIKLIPSLKGKRVLVLGCGSGPDVWWLMENGASEVVGVDLSKEQLALAKERMEKANLAAEFIQKDFDKITPNDFSKESFDIIISNYALQYAKDLPRLFKSVFHFLKPQGKFIFSCDHPILTATYKSRQKDEREKDFKDFDYLNNRTIYWNFRVGNKDVAAYNYHRSVSHIFNGLVDAEFHVDKILEPRPDTRSTDYYNESFNLAKRLPYTIIFVASKI